MVISENLSNISPWLNQIRRTRPVMSLDGNADTDVAIIGGGISGVAAAYFLLRDTDKEVLLIEGDLVAHGATGYNGGMAVAAFEELSQNLSGAFGCDLVSEGWKALEGAWSLLSTMIEESGIDPGIRMASSYVGLSSKGDLQVILKEIQLWHRMGLSCRRLFIVDDTMGGMAEDVVGDIPPVCVHFIQTVTRDELNGLLQTRGDAYLFALENKAGLLNSALFCEELASWMLDRYPGRFRVYERTPVQRIVVGNGIGGAGNADDADDADGADNAGGAGDTGGVLLHAMGHRVKAKSVVLCTNGYLDLEIEGVDPWWKEAIRRQVGFMVGYLSQEEKGPASAIYFKDSMPEHVNDYFYMTRRGYLRGQCRELTNMGGLDLPLGAGERYDPEDIPLAGKSYAEIDRFYRENIAPAAGKMDFCWNGLMGYTPTGAKIIGPDPENPSLIYDLGCNGIGILPAIYGGKRVARFIRGERLEPSIFDPVWSWKRVRGS